MNVRNAAIDFTIALPLGLLGGVALPYLFNLVSMVLRHCGGM